jgi:hypothetical protein
MIEFPTTALPPVLRDMACAVAETTSTDVSMAATAILSMISYCFSGQYRIAGKKRFIYSLHHLDIAEHLCMEFINCDKDGRLSMMDLGCIQLCGKNGHSIRKSMQKGCYSKRRDQGEAYLFSGRDSKATDSYKWRSYEISRIFLSYSVQRFPQKRNAWFGVEGY